MKADEKEDSHQRGENVEVPLSGFTARGPVQRIRASSGVKQVIAGSSYGGHNNGDLYVWGKVIGRLGLGEEGGTKKVTRAQITQHS